MNPSKAFHSDRVMSTSSQLTDISTGTTITVDSPIDHFNSNDINDALDAYEAVLKIILIEYQNEPRFKSHSPSPIPLTSSASSSSSSDRRSNIPLTPPISSKSVSSSSSSSLSKNKRHSWFGNKIVDVEALPKDTIPKLKTIMKDIATGKSKTIKDPLTKRCFLHLYNDLLKDSPQITKVEELVVIFIGIATKQIQLYDTNQDIKEQVYRQTSIFIKVLIDILKTGKNSSEKISKLQELQLSLNPKTPSKQPKNSLTFPPQSQISNSMVVVPTYRLSEISSARLLASIWRIDEIKVQQDIIKFKDIARTPLLVSELQRFQRLLQQDEAFFTKDDFDLVDGYNLWKDSVVKLNSESIENLSKSNSTQASTFQIIPKTPIEIFQKFLLKVSQYALIQNDDMIFSNQTKSLVDICARYWGIDPITQAALIYDAAHKTVLKGENNEINVEKTESLFTVLNKLLASNIPVEFWSNPNRKLWITNLSNSYIQVMASIRVNLTGIWATRAPKFTPILRIYYQYIESDPLSKYIPKDKIILKWRKRLRNCILATTESKYVEFLQILPRDHTLDFFHIKETSEKIYKAIESLQKKFPKLLLDDISIPRISGYLLISLFSEDIKNMLGHVEHYAINSGGPKNYSDALETYIELVGLRDIYKQISAETDEMFDFNLEEFFFKYMEQLVIVTCSKIPGIIKEAISKDDFTPVDLSSGKGFSSSILYIFKMIHEFLSMFRKYDWPSERQMAVIYTKLFKAVSDGLIYYSQTMKSIIMQDLVETRSPASMKTHSKRNTWNFHDVKAVLSNVNSSETIPMESYQFKDRSCVALNNLSECVRRLNELEQIIDPERIQNLTASTLRQNESKYVCTIRLLKAENIKPCGSDGLSSTYVVLMDSTLKKELGRTKIMKKTLNPQFEAEFELEITNSQNFSLIATVWNHGSKISSEDLCGRTLLNIDSRYIRKDGVPVEIVRDLDIQGTLYFQISLESETDDILFSFGKSQRSFKRTMEFLYASFVEKFSVFITNSFSRQTLKLVCGNNGKESKHPNQIIDAIIPLFNYLNENLRTLARVLDQDILVKIMIEAWMIVLNTADNLLLPALASVKAMNSLSMNIKWKESLSSAVANVTNIAFIPGFGRSLSLQEVDAVFMWLNELCSFFYNGGAGPELSLLKNDYYQRLLLIQKNYDEDRNYLISEVEKLTPLVLKAIKAKNFLGDDGGNGKEYRAQVARKNTVLAYASSRRRVETKKAVKEFEQDEKLFQISVEDTLLRILIAKEEKEFVNKRLVERERVSKSIATEKLARMVVHQGNFRNLV